jgi:hypothetical protein
VPEEATVQRRRFSLQVATNGTEIELQQEGVKEPKSKMELVTGAIVPFAKPSDWLI